ncbi:sensor domain-containing protein [Methylobacterium komagatae]
MDEFRAPTLPDGTAHRPEPALTARRDGHLDTICRIAAKQFGTRFASVGWYDAGRHHIIGHADLAPDGSPDVGHDWTGAEDAAEGPRVILDTRGNPRFLAGVPAGLTGQGHRAILWIADVKPRARFEAEQIRQLSEIAALVGGHLSLSDLHQRLANKVQVLRAMGVRHAVEDALRDSETRYRVLAEALPQMILISCAATDETTYVNRNFEDYHGPIGPSREARFTLVHPDDRMGLNQVWGEARAKGVRSEIEVRLRRWDGTYRWHKVVAVPILLKGSIVSVMGTAVDTDESVKARRDLEQTTERLQLTHVAAGAGEFVWDMRTGLVSLSPVSARLHGLPVPDDAQDAPVIVSMAQLKTSILAADLPRVRRAMKRAEAGQATNIIEYRTRVSDGPGGHRWIESHGRAIAEGSDDRPLRFVGLHLDVTDRHRAEEALRASREHLRISEERLALALNSGGDGLFDWNLSTDAFWTSGGWLSKLGYDSDGSTEAGCFFLSTVHPDDRQAVRAQLVAHLRGLIPTVETEYRYLRADGGFVWVLNRARVAARDAAGRALRLVGTLIDISRRKEAEMHIAHLAHHDALTDLPNRTLFRQNLDRMLAQVEHTRDHFAVLACDLDGFKTINDTLGHLVGDAVLRIVASRLCAMVRANDTVSRQGGDEFSIILGNIDGEAMASAVCQRIIAAIDEPIQVDDLSIDLTISIGVVLVSSAEVSAKDVLTRADTALYQAKALGRNTYSLFEATAHARTATRNLLALDMREAIRRGDFFLVYQPVIEVASGAVTSFEALMRWRHPVHGLISPADFIPVAEETGMIVPLGAWALQEACREALTWPEQVRVGVNVSPVQFRGGLEEHVKTALINAALPAQRLKLEVTESVLMRDADDALACLHRLRALGVRIALDDFGTGYSSLSYLRRFPFDKLKIDRTFIRDIADPDAAAIVRAVAGLGERLGMVIVAEGVETEEQLALVRREGCTEVQGFLFSKPLPAEEARAFLRSRRCEQDAA